MGTAIDIGPGGDDVRWVVEGFERTGDIESLLAAHLPPAAAVRRDALCDLAKAHWYRYRALSGFEGLLDREAAVAIASALGRRDRAGLPAGLRDATPDAAVALVTGVPEFGELELAQLTHARHRDLESLVEVANAYTALMNALEDDRMSAALTSDQVAVLLAIDGHEGESRYADAAFAGLTWVVNHTSEDDPQRARRLLERAQVRAATGGRVSRVLADHKAAARLALRETPVWRDIVVELAQVQWDTYARTGEPRYLIEALATCRDLADALARDFGDGVSLPALHDIANEVTAVLGAEQTEWLLRTHRDPHALEGQYGLVDGLRAQAVTASSPDLVRRRLDATLWLVSALPLNHPDRPHGLVELYLVHVDAWEFEGDAAAVAEAYEVANEALLITDSDHPARGQVLLAIAHSATALAKHTGSADAAKQAVDAARAALDLAAAGDRDERARRLSNLALALTAAFKVGGHTWAGHEAYDRAQEAVALTPPDAANYALHCSTLCATAGDVAEATGDAEMLAKAVEAGAWAVAATPAGDVRRVGHLYNYAGAVQRLACQSSEPGSFDEAERALRAALALLPDGHPDHPRIGSTIADVLFHRHRLCGDPDALITSVALAEQAVLETPRDHHWWPLRALALARSACTLAAFGGPDADALRRTAISHYRAIGEHPVATAEHRMIAERAQADLLAEADPTTFLDAQERVIAAIPATVSRALTGARRLAAVRWLDGLADQVVHTGVRAGEEDRALTLLEQCRCLLFGDAWGVRRGWARLRDVRPHLARSLSDVERDLTHADLHASVKFIIEVSVGDCEGVQREWDPRPQVVDRIRRLAATRDHLLAEIRELPGFEDLLTPPDTAVLRDRLAGHTVVVVSAHTESGAALVVPADPAQTAYAVHLPQLTRSAARRQVTRMRAALADAKDPASSFDRREEAQQDVHGVLEWLWDTTAGPVLDRVAPHHPGRTPRLWWCPIGAAAQLPLHAAGRHRAADRSARTVLDRVIPSYTPSLTALADTLGAHTLQPPHRTALVVGVGTVEGQLVLPNAHAEAEAVARLIPGSTVLLDEAASVDAIKRGLHEHAIAHFACHGAAISSDAPTDLGGLVLSDRKFVPTFVHDLRTTHAQLAFLSACDTAGADPGELDEPLNLAAAFHLAGFRSVIGTLWHTQDSPETAGAVYTALTAGGTQPVDTTSAATALTHALRRIRDAYPAVPTRWASHVHVGL